ncbi:MAG TPA: lipoyl synthase [Chloroflexia bacterium]|nr:lipoyl synthase [Chloroflexia bacterium]
MSDTIKDQVSFAPLELRPYSRPGGPARPVSTVPVPVDRKPPWLTVKWQQGENYRDLKTLMRGLGLHTVCEEAHCPNISECWEHRTATFLILGDTCTRSCGFCAIKTGRPGKLDREEPERVARAIETLKLQHVVITSVNRDELPDGGAEIFAETIRLSRQYTPECGIEVLIPDFRGVWWALQLVMDARPNILNHNIESVPRLYYIVRPQAKYERSLELLKRAKDMDPTHSDIYTKSGLMVGLGEEWDEVVQVLHDLREHEVDIVTIGQYLRPSFRHLPVLKYYTPDEFKVLKEIALEMGFKHVESGPLVRSSYHAHEQVKQAADVSHSHVAATSLA